MEYRDSLYNRDDSLTFIQGSKDMHEERGHVPVELKLEKSIRMKQKGKRLGLL